jgi:4-hydroxybenzoate polyprenyltransferase
MLGMRPKQIIKNLLIFFPLLFSGQLFNVTSIAQVSLIFFIFSIFVGSTYIINDRKDKENDKKHPQKRERPLASGKLKVPFALFFAIIFIIGSLIASYWV